MSKILNILLGSSIIVSSLALQATENSLPSRKEEVAQFFLKEANDKNSEIGKILESTRHELGNGFVDSSEVIADPLEAKSIDLLQTLYTTFEGTENHDSFQNGEYIVSVPVESAVYGGRILTLSSVNFLCSYKSVNEYVKVSEINCKKIEIK